MDELSSLNTEQEVRSFLYHLNKKKQLQQQQILDRNDNDGVTVTTTIESGTRNNTTTNKEIGYTEFSESQNTEFKTNNNITNNTTKDELSTTATATAATTTMTREKGRRINRKIPSRSTINNNSNNNCLDEAEDEVFIQDNGSNSNSNSIEQHSNNPNNNKSMIPSVTYKNWPNQYVSPPNQWNPFTRSNEELQLELQESFQDPFTELRLSQRRTNYNDDDNENDTANNDNNMRKKGSLLTANAEALINALENNTSYANHDLEPFRNNNNNNNDTKKDDVKYVAYTDDVQSMIHSLNKKDIDTMWDKVDFGRPPVADYTVALYIRHLRNIEKAEQVMADMRKHGMWTLYCYDYYVC